MRAWRWPRRRRARSECGDTVSQDRKLKADIVDCDDTGLFIDGNRTTLDMNGHAIRNTSGPGIDTLDAKRTTIKNGEIRDAGTWGFLTSENPGLKLSNLDIIDAGNRGVEVRESSGITIKKVVVRRSANDAFFLNAVSDAVLTDVAVVKGDGAGFDIADIADLTLENASVEGDGVTNSGGISVVGTAEDSTFRDIEIQDWGGSGLLFTATGAGNVIGDVASRENEYGFEIGDGQPKVRDAVATGNDEDGLLVNGVADVRVTGGRFNGNDEDGIQFTGGAAGAVGDNVANNNAGVGILLPAAGVTDLGGNRAAGNGDKDCVNVSC